MKYIAVQQDYPLAPFLDDCKLLESLLDDCLRLEVGEDLFQKFEAIRELSRCASQLAAKGDKVKPGDCCCKRS